MSIAELVFTLVAKYGIDFGMKAYETMTKENATPADYQACFDLAKKPLTDYVEKPAVDSNSSDAKP